MDGSVSSVIELNLHSATSLVVDVPMKRLYYVQKNKIFSLRFDGTDMQVRIRELYMKLITNLLYI